MLLVPFYPCPSFLVCDTLVLPLLSLHQVSYSVQSRLSSKLSPSGRAHPPWVRTCFGRGAGVSIAFRRSDLGRGATFWISAYYHKSCWFQRSLASANMLDIRKEKGRKGRLMNIWWLVRTSFWAAFWAACCWLLGEGEMLRKIAICKDGSSWRVIWHWDLRTWEAQKVIGLLVSPLQMLGATFNKFILRSYKRRRRRLNGKAHSFFSASLSSATHLKVEMCKSP